MSESFKPLFYGRSCSTSSLQAHFRGLFVCLMILLERGIKEVVGLFKQVKGYLFRQALNGGLITPKQGVEEYYYKQYSHS